MPDPSLEPQGGGFNLADWSGSAGLDDDAFEAIGQTVQHAAGAIDGLKDILERLQSSVAEATEQRRNDIEIGQLFMRAQDFVEGAVTEGHALAQRIVADAEFEAARIILAAKEEARRLVEEAKSSASLPSEAVLALQATIREFGRMNQVLVHELSGLSQALDNRRETANGVASLASADGAPEKQWAELAGGSAPPQANNADALFADGQLPVTSPAPQEPSPQTGYWSTLKATKETPEPRVGRHGAPGARWRMR
jgi:cell division septum initiation protein DivIVA